MRYRVAEFTIDTARFRISAGDAPVPVEPKVFDLLVHLIRHRDRVLAQLAEVTGHLGAIEAKIGIYEDRLERTAASA